VGIEFHLHFGVVQEIMSERVIRDELMGNLNLCVNFLHLSGLLIRASGNAV
jgi:hypothetical protein